MFQPVERVIWSPGANWPQWAMIQCPVFEIFFGGARGGGKTDGVLGEWLAHANQYGDKAAGLMVRRTRTELIDTIERSKAIYGPLHWKYQEQDKIWRCPKGSRLRFAYLERDADAELYQGHSYTRVYIEEVGNFPSPVPVMKLMATLRSGAGVPVGMRLDRQSRRSGASMGESALRRSGAARQQGHFRSCDRAQPRVHPVKVDNNVFIDAEAYKQRLRASGSAELVAAWLAGDWSVTLGAFFDCWDTNRHVIRPFDVPKDWMRFRSMDWGSASPFSVQWWAVVTDDYDINDHHLPRGCMVLYRTWYGMKPGQPNVGLKLHAAEVGKGIYEREKGEEISYGVLDPSAFAEDGGPSIAESMGTGSGGKVWFRRADNRRIKFKGSVGGWNEMRSRLVGNDDGHAMLVVFSTCVDFIRTVPFLQHDPEHIEDVLTDSEDHEGDCCRYACMSRPYARVKEEPKPEDISAAMRRSSRPHNRAIGGRTDFDCYRYGAMLATSPEVQSCVPPSSVPTIQEFRGVRYYRCGAYFQHNEVTAASGGMVASSRVDHRAAIISFTRTTTVPTTAIGNLECLTAQEHGLLHGPAQARVTAASSLKLAHGSAAWPERSGQRWHAQHGKICAGVTPPRYAVREQCRTSMASKRASAGYAESVGRHCRAEISGRRPARWIAAGPNSLHHDRTPHQVLERLQIGRLPVNRSHDAD